MENCPRRNNALERRNGLDAGRVHTSRESEDRRLARKGQEIILSFTERMLIAAMEEKNDLARGHADRRPIAQPQDGASDRRRRRRRSLVSTCVGWFNRRLTRIERRFRRRTTTAAAAAAAMNISAGPRNQSASSATQTTSSSISKDPDDAGDDDHLPDQSKHRIDSAVAGLEDEIRRRVTGHEYCGMRSCWQCTRGSWYDEA